MAKVVKVRERHGKRRSNSLMLRSTQFQDKRMNYATILGCKGCDRDHWREFKYGTNICFKVVNVGMLFHVIVITQRNSILKFYNNLQDHQTQTNKHIITKQVLDYYPCRHGILKTLLSSVFDPRTSSQGDPSTVDSTPPIFYVIHLLNE